MTICQGYSCAPISSPAAINNRLHPTDLVIHPFLRGSYVALVHNTASMPHAAKYYLATDDLLLSVHKNFI